MKATRKPRIKKLPFGRNGRQRDISIDQRTGDRLTWAKAATLHLLNIDAGHSVIMRVALDYFTRKLDGLLEAPDKEELDRLALSLSGAARGQTLPLPEEQLTAMPPLAFSAIEAAAHAARMVELKETSHEILREGPFSGLPAFPVHPGLDPHSNEDRDE